MNEQIIAALIAAIVGFITNVVIKKIEKEKPKEEKDKTAIETAEKSLRIMKETLLVLEDKNKKLEDKMLQYEDNKQLINMLYSIIYDILQSPEIIIPPEKRKEIETSIQRGWKNAKTEN
jgi:mannitol-specific phosphotransferase system IIBC component